MSPQSNSTITNKLGVSNQKPQNIKTMNTINRGSSNTKKSDINLT